MSDAAIIKPFGPKAWREIMRPPIKDKRITIFEGSVRSSKTFTLDAKTIVQLSRYEAIPANAKRLMTGATKQTLFRNVLIDLFSIAGRENYSYNSSTGELWLFGKQWFCLGAKDEGSYKQILGSTVGLHVGDEVVEYPKSFLAQLWLRMSPDNARSYSSTNPGNPYCYLKAEVIDNPDFKAMMRVVHFTLNDNPNISPAAKAAIIASQVGVYKLRYIDGLWVVAEGSIYRDSWDDRLNTYANTARLSNDKKFTHQTAPIGLTNKGGYVDHWFALDAGVDHPQVYGEFYDDGRRVRLHRTWRWDSRKQMKQLTDSQYVDELEKFMEPTNGKGCEVRVPPECASLRAELLLRGHYVVDADNEVGEGIHTVSTLLSQRNLLINVDECNGIETMIPNYAWDEKAANRGIEQPLKKNDDDVDMLRYGVHGKIPAWRLLSDLQVQ
jgi:PBSX family phage terminase large subunit